MHIIGRRGGLAAGLLGFGRDRRGATAVTFALTFAVLAPLTLGVMDIYGSTQQRGKLQDALDAATLYAARSTAQTDEAIEVQGDKALDANLTLIHGAELKASSFDLVGTKVVSSATVKVQSFAPAYWDSPPVTVHSEVQRAMDKLEIALVLDNTGSMAGTKLATLKTEAKSLVDKLAAAALRSADPTPIKIALVPFSSMVRVQGTTPLLDTAYNPVSHSGAGIPSWIDPQAKWQTSSTTRLLGDKTDRLEMMRNMGKPWEGCVEQRPQPYDITEDVPTSLTPGTMYVPYFWPDEIGNKTSASNSQLNDYLVDPGSGTWKEKQQSVAKYTGTPRSGTFMAGYTYGPNAGCGLQPVIRLTTDTGAIKTGIDNMVAVGETNIPQGLAWGWNAVSPVGPFADGSPYGTKHLKKVIILMTDGQNTFMNISSGSNKSWYHGLGYIWQTTLSGLMGSSTDAERTAAMDARLGLLCANIKAKNIEVYTIRVEVTSGTSTLLRNCATTADRFYDVQSVTTLGAAFDAIAGSITNLRIAH